MSKYQKEIEKAAENHQKGGYEWQEEKRISFKAGAEWQKQNTNDKVAIELLGWLTENFFQVNGKPDVIITDPPRAGMHADVVEQINKSGAKRIVYVSCNPATQARDIALMSEKYKVIKVQPVDMFPHTAHVENVALLELIG